jgi:hypothetical protein
MTSPASHHPARSDEGDGFCARPFWPTAFRVLDPLSFAEGLKGRALHGRVVKEQFAPFTLDESKTLLRNQFLDRALCHTLNYSLKHLKQNGKQKRTLAAQPPDPCGNLARRSHGRGSQVNCDQRDVRSESQQRDRRGRIQKEAEGA